MKNQFFTGILFLVAITTHAQQNDSAQFYFNKGNTEFTNRRWLVASQAFDKAISYNPKYTEAYLQNGYACLEMRKMDNAIKNFAKVNELEPANETAIKELMTLYYNYHQYDKAIEFGRKTKNNPAAERIMAMSYFYKEEYGMAEKGLLSSLQKNPADGETNYLLAKCYLEMENTVKAVEFYKKGIELSPSKYDWMNELGVVYYQLDDYKNAALYFEKAQAAGIPITSSFTENLGYSYIYSGNFDKGEKILLAQWEKKPTNKDILRDLAEAFYFTKKYDKSLEYCQKILNLDDKDAKAYYQAGLCYIKKGEKSKGEQFCDKAIAMDGSLAKLRRQEMMSVGL